MTAYTNAPQRGRSVLFSLFFLFTCALLTLGTSQIGCDPKTEPADASTQEQTAPDQAPGEGKGTDSTSTTSKLAFVLTTADKTGSYSTINTKTKTAQNNLGSAHSDAVARYWKGRIFVINRLGQDNIQVLNSSTLALEKQYSVGTASNPQDIAIVSDEKAYVSRLASAKLLIINPLTGDKKGEIDLTSFTEASEKTCTEDSECSTTMKCDAGTCASDGLPEMAQMMLVGTKLYILIQKLDRNDLFTPKGKGTIVVVDTATDKAGAPIELANINPRDFIVDEDKGVFYVPQTGLYGKADGVIESFDLATGASKGVIFKEEKLGGDLNQVAIVNDTLGYTIRTDAAFKTELVQLNLTDESVKVVATPTCEGNCFLYTTLAYDKDAKEIYLGDKTPGKTGIRVFNAESGDEVTTAPIDLGSVPAYIIFYPSTP